MIKKHIILICLLFVSNLVKSQDYLRNNVSIGYGFPNLSLIGFNSINFFTDKKDFMSKGTGPLHLKYENRINKYIGLGVNMNYVSYHVSYIEEQFDTIQGIPAPNKIDINYWNLATNLRANFYFFSPEERPIDLYLGFGIGFRYGKFKLTASNEQFAPSIGLPNLSYLGLESTLGCRYFPSENIGIYSELGLAKSIFQIGVTGRF